MRKNTEITGEDFKNLLGCFSSDTEEAARKYEEIRRGLIDFFYYRGATDGESLADETINRVAKKLPTANFSENFKPAAYFYSFAAKIHLEDRRERLKIAVNIEEIESLAGPDNKLDEKDSAGAVCLEKCLAEHSPDESKILLRYYGFERNERTQARRSLAEENRINIGLLHTKISRLKKTLRGCLKKCLNKK